MVLALGLVLAQTATTSAISIIPKPQSLTVEKGFFALKGNIDIASGSGCEGVSHYLLSEMKRVPQLHLHAPIFSRGKTISLAIDGNLLSAGRESYRMSVSSSEIKISGATAAGVFYGVQSLRQMLPTSFFSTKPAAGTYAIPACEIADGPIYRWRGTHIDVCRHFMPKSEILKFIDVLAMHKMNVLHLHLTDDQGWRIEIKQYPKLTSIGSKRSESQIGHYDEHKFDHTPVDGFYTQEDIKQMVRYAAARFITIVPEIEMPGHSQAAVTAYPEYGNSGKSHEVLTGWGVSADIYAPTDKTIKFLENVLDEVMALFPSKFIHVGGDEVPKEPWHNNPVAQEKMKSMGLKNEDELQSWFISQIDRYLTMKGRRLIGWDEILEGGLAPGAAVMSWRGEEGGIAAAQAGHDVVMAPGTYTYLDQYQSTDTKSEPIAIGGYLPLYRVWAYDPTPPQLTGAEKRHILGAQSQLWTEYIATPMHLEYMAFPRMNALAEALWSAGANRNYPDFLSRLRVDLKRFDNLGINYRHLEANPDVLIGFWKPSANPEMTMINQTLSLKGAASGPGTYRLTFDYRRGKDATEIDSVNLVANQGGHDTTFPLNLSGIAGNDQKLKHVFSFSIPSGITNPRLQVTTHPTEGNDSYGQIILRKMSS